MPFWRHLHTINDVEALRRVWPQVIADARLIVEASGVELQLAADDESAPVLDEENGIRFNWRPSNDGNDAAAAAVFARRGPAEDFVLSLREGEVRHWTETNKYPYDKVVTAVLLRTWQLAGDEGIALDSDSQWLPWYIDDWSQETNRLKSPMNMNDWAEAILLIHQLWPEQRIVCPWKR